MLLNDAGDKLRFAARRFAQIVVSGLVNVGEIFFLSTTRKRPGLEKMCMWLLWLLWRCQGHDRRPARVLNVGARFLEWE